MREIIYAVGAAVFFIKGINMMTDKAVEKCLLFRVFRAVFWGGLSVVTAVAFWVAVVHLYRTTL